LTTAAPLIHLATTEEEMLEFQVVSAELMIAGTNLQIKQQNCRITEVGRYFWGLSSPAPQCAQPLIVCQTLQSRSHFSSPFPSLSKLIDDDT